MIDTTRELIVVTGGTGFIGSNLVERLVADGKRVRVFARKPATTLARPGGKHEIVWGDIRDADAVSQAIAGAHTVYHLAGCAKAWTRDASEFDEVNGRGTENVCEAAGRHDVTRLIHVSTALVAPPHGHSHGNGVAAHTRYQRSKAGGERVVREFVRRGGDAVIVRPTRVYGPGPMTQSNSVTRLIDLYRRGLFRFRIDDGDALANYVYVEDVVQGMLSAAKRGTTGSAYFLAGENCTLRDLLAHVSRAGARRRLVCAVPVAGARLVGSVCEAAARIGIPPLITRDWVDLLSTDWPISSGQLVAQLGLRPRSLASGIGETIRWLEASKSDRRAPRSAQFTAS